jgi:hypothetical protein
MERFVHNGREAALNYLEFLLVNNDIDRLQGELRGLVCNHYWWLAGELYDVEGKLGWCPGHLDDDEDHDLDLVKAEDGLRDFICLLTEIPKSDAVEDLISTAFDYTNVTLEARAVRYVLDKAEAWNPNVSIWYVYDRIVAKGTVYQIAAAREYLYYYTENKGDPNVALAGLVLILARRLDQHKVKAEVSLLKRFESLDYWGYVGSAISCNVQEEAVNL